MWKTFYLLLLMLFTFDFPRDSLAGAEPVRANAELVTRDDDQSHRKETRGRLESRDEHAAELVGKWRNNGEALEPKWRDGDTVPLFPFSQFSRFSRDKIDNTEEEDDYDHRRAKYRQHNRQEDFHRSRSNPPLSYSNYEGYQSTEGRREYREREEIFPRKRNRPWTGENAATVKEASNRREEQNKDFKEDKETTSTRYRELFQVRPNDYEHEFHDEEYLKPRPRKRRPPQNYEFALAENETSLNGGRTNSNSGPWSRVNIQESPQPVASKNSPFLQNAMELKSLLKMQQEEGLSLSEILQQRNLTLNDLLKGKADVINALKKKNADETEDYVEEAAKMISDSFVKLPTTRKSQWTFTTESVKVNSQKDEEFVFSIVPTNPAPCKNHTDAKGSFPSRVNDNKMYSGAGNATTGKSILASVDPPQSKVTITTQMPLPVATNSMEFLQTDDAVVKLQSSGETRTESLDEDEIMEFSDFTDYKKGRSGVSPVWLIIKDGTVSDPSIENSKSHFEDKGSTLSIEKILSPTERSKSMSNLSDNSKDREQFFVDSININNSRIFEDDDQYSEKDYSTSSEKEYQGDTPMMYYDLEQSTQVSNESDENDRNKEIIKNIASTLDTVSQNSTINNHQTLSKNLSVEKNSNNTSKNDTINTTKKKSYDDIISEVEPEARAEIFELFASGSAGKRLERLLKSRNMSLEELIALRQRGSSKVHLAEVSRIRAQKSNGGYQINDTNNFEIINSLPSKESLPTEGRTIANHENYDKGIGNYLSQSPENFKNSDSLTNFVHPQESINEQLMPNLESKTNNGDSELYTSTKMDSVMAETKEKHRTVQIVDLLTTFGSLPFMKDIQQDFEDQYNTEDKEHIQNSNLGVVFINNAAETIGINDTSNVVQSGFVKEIVKQEPSSIDIQTIYSKTNNILGEDETKSEKGKTLSKVKPSIIASGAILGVTLVVFLAIFIVCRIRQKQKYRYRNTFSRAVFQGPVMAARKLSNSSSLSTVMVNVVATSTTKRPEKNETQESIGEMDSKSDIDNDSLDANDSWETIPDYMK